MTRKILPLPSQALLRTLLSYNKRTGVFLWRKPVGTAAAGTVAGWKHRSGYTYIGIHGVQYKAHRLAWVYVYGEAPVGLVDHVDRDVTNNRIKNLRDVTDGQSNQNKRVYKNSLSGHKGVGWYAPTGKWRVRIQHEGRVLALGHYNDLTAAIAARDKAEKALHTHAA